MAGTYETMSVEIQGKQCRAIKANNKTYVEPWFGGDIQGTVMGVLNDKKKGGIHILLGPDTFLDYDVWIYLPYAEMRKLGVHRPKILDYVGFTIREKIRHPSNTRWYQIEKVWEVTNPWNCPTP